MNVCASFSESALIELDRTASLLRHLRSACSELEQRQQLLMQVLDEATRPAVPCRVIGPGYLYRGTFIRCWSRTHLYVSAMRHLWLEYEPHREVILAALGQYGRLRSYLAESPEQLYASRSSPWAAKHSEKLSDGWFIDTNLNTDTKRKLLAAVLRACEVPVSEFVAYWREGWVELPVTMKSQ